MVTPEEIRKKALHRYPRFLLSRITGDEFFPLIIPADKGKSTDAFLERKRGLEKLLSHSKDKNGYGYRLIFTEINTRQTGRQSVLSEIAFEGIEDFLRFIEKTEEFQGFERDRERISSFDTRLKEWLPQNIPLVIKYLGEWEELLMICRYFQDNPRPGIYIREIPLPIHTKFIEEKSGVLKKLLDLLLPKESINTDESSFAGRYFLKSPEPMIRFRSLDPQVHFLGEEEIALPVNRFGTGTYPVKRVIIIENLIPYLTFPRVYQGMAVWGKGFSANALKLAHWMKDKELYYWGDMDPAGLQILSMVRGHFPKTQSLFMCYEHYHAFKKWAVTGSASGSLCLDNLNDEERQLLDYLNAHPEVNRLEQERLPQRVVIEEVSRLFG